MNRELLKKNFEARGYHVYFFDTKEEAADFIRTQVAGMKVGMGGCLSAARMGLKDIPTSRDASEAYFVSANGVAETGELVNIDGYGNRVAATLCGTQHLYWIIGKNKIRPTLAEAMDRAKNIAAPLNAQRLGKKTPCAEKADKCYHCNLVGNPESICHGTVIHDGPMRGMDTHVIFIDEDLGL